MPLTFSNSASNDDTYAISLSAPGALVGATVSALVYTTLSTAGDILAVATGTGIELTGNLVAYGAELAIGSIPAHTVRIAAKTYGALARPAISNTSRLGAMGISVLVGAGAAFTTSAVIYGGKQCSSYVCSYIKDYKQCIAQKIQHPLDPGMTLLYINDMDEDELLIIEEDTITHFHQDEPS